MKVYIISDEDYEPLFTTKNAGLYHHAVAELGGEGNEYYRFQELEVETEAPEFWYDLTLYYNTTALEDFDETVAEELEVNIRRPQYTEKATSTDYYLTVEGPNKAEVIDRARKMLIAGPKKNPSVDVHNVTSKHNPKTCKWCKESK